MIIRAKHFDNWMRANFTKEELKDIATSGCINGFPGLTYYKDTVKLYDKFEADIWERLSIQADNMAYTGVIEFVADFNGAENVGDADTFKNLLVWWMAESLAYEWTNRED